jgi:hypothetical protein
MKRNRLDQKDIGEKRWSFWTVGRGLILECLVLGSNRQNQINKINSAAACHETRQVPHLSGRYILHMMVSIIKIIMRRQQEMQEFSNRQFKTSTKTNNKTINTTKTKSCLCSSSTSQSGGGYGGGASTKTPSFSATAPGGNAKQKLLVMT